MTGGLEVARPGPRSSGSRWPLCSAVSARTEAPACPVQDGALCARVAPGPGSSSRRCSWPHALEVDGAFLYWLTRSGQVMRLAKPGGSGGPPATSACAGNPGQAFPVLLSQVGGFGGLGRAARARSESGSSTHEIACYFTDGPLAQAIVSMDRPNPAARKPSDTRLLRFGVCRAGEAGHDARLVIFPGPLIDLGA